MSNLSIDEIKEMFSNDPQKMAEYIQGLIPPTPIQTPPIKFERLIHIKGEPVKCEGAYSRQGSNMLVNIMIPIMKTRTSFHINSTKLMPDGIVSEDDGIELYGITGIGTQFVFITKVKGWDEFINPNKYTTMNWNEKLFNKQLDTPTKL